jgi:hypothetical protein
LRLDPFTFIKSVRTSPETGCFRGVIRKWPEKTFFPADQPHLVYFRLTVVRFLARRPHLSTACEFTLNPALAEGVISRRTRDMNKTFAALVAVATLAGSLAVTPASAQRGLGAAVAGGLIGGAIVGGAIAASRPAYGGPAYVEDAPPPPCRFVRERFWDGYAWRFRRVEVCN